MWQWRFGTDRQKLSRIKGSSSPSSQLLLFFSFEDLKIIVNNSLECLHIVPIIKQTIFEHIKKGIDERTNRPTNLLREAFQTQMRYYLGIFPNLSDPRPPLFFGKFLKVGKIQIFFNPPLWEIFEIFKISFSGSMDQETHLVRNV